MSRNLDDYIEVPDRIKQFKEAFPDGSLDGDWRLEQIGDRTFIVYVARAYRTPDDPRPGVGTAWEPYPGHTPFTKDSELMNAETSAWGRALVALGFVGKKIASKEEVQGRTPADPMPGARLNAKGDGPTVKQRNELVRLVKLLGASPESVALVESFVAGSQLTVSQASGWLDALKADDRDAGKEAAKGLVGAARRWVEARDALPADTEGLAA